MGWWYAACVRVRRCLARKKEYTGGCSVFVSAYVRVCAVDTAVCCVFVWSLISIVASLLLFECVLEPVHLCNDDRQQYNKL